MTGEWGGVCSHLLQHIHRTPGLELNIPHGGTKSKRIHSDMHTHTQQHSARVGVARPTLPLVRTSIFLLTLFLVLLLDSTRTRSPAHGPKHNRVCLLLMASDTDTTVCSCYGCNRCTRAQIQRHRDDWRMSVLGTRGGVGGGGGHLLQHSHQTPGLELNIPHVCTKSKRIHSDMHTHTQQHSARVSVARRPALWL